MKRRHFLASAGVAAAAAPLAAPALAQGKIEWKMVTAWPKNAPGVGMNAQRLADRITALSEGRLSVKLFAAGELVPPFGGFDAVASGAAEMCHATPYYWQGKTKAVHYFTGVPFGMTAPEMMGWIYFGGGQALWDEVYDKFGLKGFYVGSSGVQSGGWFRKEIKSVADLKGLKFRIAGLGGDVFKKLGVVVTLTPPGEIFAAMQSGAVDAAEWVGPWNDLAFGLHRIAKFYYQPAFHEPGPALEAIVDKKKLLALPPALQKIVESACQATAAETLADFTRHNIEALEPLVRDHGVQLRLWPDDIVKAAGAAWKEVQAEVVAGDALTAKVNDSFVAYLKKARQWAKWSDLPMLRMREEALGG
ncbi:MAG: TRAP transporter substrate-binding protein [Alphaproteobacteria bacterium]|nr:TRAP transporter substrate-binding protein [Alphaproteobacteria bacterium]